MNYYVYMLLTKRAGKFISYVGYTNNLKKRVNMHNTSKGAKFTKGSNWNVIYKKKFISKINALKYEILLKRDRKLRNKIKTKALSL